MSQQPVSSVRSLGTDPHPYLFPETGERSDSPSYLRLCLYRPRPEFTHVPVAPSDLLCGFRDDWSDSDLRAEYDLGEYAQMRLEATEDDGTREMRLYRRFLHLCATALPRPYARFRPSQAA